MRSAVPSLTVDDLDLMPEDGSRYELIEGELQVSKAPNFLHQTIATNITHLINQYLDSHPIGVVVAAPGIIFNRATKVIPDVAFILNERLNQILEGERLTGAPDIVVEILSPGAENVRRDRVAKLALYARYQVPEYWIVDPKRRSVEVYTLNENLYTLEGKYTESLSSARLPGFSCQLERVFTLRR